jgi:hypothetical protein
MSVLALSSELVKTLTCPSLKRKLTIFDSACKNLVIEVHASGRKTYYFRYRDARNIVRQPKLCDANDLSLKQVRQLADKYRQQLAMNIDPFAAKANLKKAPTVKSFCSATITLSGRRQLS